MNWRALVCAIIGHSKEEDCKIIVTKTSRKVIQKRKLVRTRAVYTGQLVCPRCGAILRNLGELWGFENDFPSQFKNRANGER